MSKEAGQVRLASLIYLEERGALHKAILFSCKKTKARVQKIIKAWAQDRKILACAKDLGVRRKGAKSESPRLRESRRACGVRRRIIKAWAQDRKAPACLKSASVRRKGVLR